MLFVCTQYGTLLSLTVILSAAKNLATIVFLSLSKGQKQSAMQSFKQKITPEKNGLKHT